MCRLAPGIGGGDHGRPHHENVAGPGAARADAGTSGAHPKFFGRKFNLPAGQQRCQWEWRWKSELKRVGSNYAHRMKMKHDMLHKAGMQNQDPKDDMEDLVAACENRNFEAVKMLLKRVKHLDYEDDKTGRNCVSEAVINYQKSVKHEREGKESKAARNARRIVKALLEHIQTKGYHKETHDPPMPQWQYVCIQFPLSFPSPFPFCTHTRTKRGPGSNRSRCCFGCGVGR